MFDILSDSALDIAIGLVGDAWGGTAPSGGFDFPSSCVLSKCDYSISDCHIELGVIDNTDQLSEVPWLADVTRTDPAGPSDTDSPFRFSSGEAAAPGIFGKALRAYGETVAICNEYGVPSANYDNWFRIQWGIEPGADLTTAVPVVRSHGDALWGGLGRKLAPSAYSHLATSKQIKVVWHGNTREKYGEHKLVDWPRLTAIARTIGAALLVEDRYSASRLKRIDFRVVAREIPVAPSGIGTALGEIPIMSNWATRDISRGAIEFLQGFRSAALLLARHALGGSGALEIEDGYAIPSESLLKFLAVQQKQAVPVIDFLDAYEGGFDLDDAAAPSVRVPEAMRSASVFDAFAAVMRPFVEKNLANIPYPYQIRNLVDTMEGGTREESESATDTLKQLIKDTVPDDFLVRIYRVFAIVNRDRNKGGDIVVSLLRALKAPQSVFETKNLVSVGVRVKNHSRCYKWISDEIARAVTRTVREKGQEAVIAGALRRILSNASTGDIAIAEIVRKRRNWWANEYRRRAKHMDARKVEFQVKSRLFRVVKIIASIDSGVYVDIGDPALVTILEATARAFLRKRKVYLAQDPIPPDPGHANGRQYCQILDRELSPRVLFADIWDSFVRSADMLANDVIEILDYAANDTQFGSVAPDGGLSDDIDSDIESDIAPTPDETVPSALFSDDEDEDPITPVVAKQSGGFMDSDSDEDDTEDLSGKLDLAMELHDDHPHIPGDYIARAIAEFGNYVSVEDCKRISVLVNEEYVRATSKPAVSSELTGYDVSDIL